MIYRYKIFVFFNTNKTIFYMIIGIPKELKPGEARVGITPQATKELTSTDNKVLIHKDAGILSGYSNNDYKEAGAEIVEHLEELWAKSELLLKVKEPAREEREFFRENLTVFSFLHPASDKDLVQKLVKAKTTGISFDLLQDEENSFPILTPMSEIAGRLSIFAAASALWPHNNGQGILLGKDTNVLVIGAGVSGNAAIDSAIGLSTNVCVLDLNESKIKELNAKGIRARISNRENLVEELKIADVVIGAVYVPADLAPKIIKEEDLKVMKKGSVVVDISIDQGGILETSKTTSISKPTFINNGVVHYCVPNMPALAPKTATINLNKAVMPWLKQLIKSSDVSKEQYLASGIATFKGQIFNETVKKAINA